jgi:hypothetical protein
MQVPFPPLGRSRCLAWRTGCTGPQTHSFVILGTLTVRSSPNRLMTAVAEVRPAAGFAEVRPLFDDEIRQLELLGEDPEPGEGCLPPHP